MKMNKYCVKNVISGIANNIILAKTDAEMSRCVTHDLMSIEPSKRVYKLSDFQILRIGTFDTETLDETILDTPVVVPYDNRLIAERDGSADVKEVVSDLNNIK